MLMDLWRGNASFEEHMAEQSFSPHVVWEAEGKIDTVIPQSPLMVCLQGPKAFH
jgi:hypothetical protein